VNGLLSRPGRVREELIPAGATLAVPLAHGHISPGIRPRAGTGDNTAIETRNTAIVAGGSQHGRGASTYFPDGATVESGGSYTGSQSAYLDGALGVSVGCWIRMVGMSGTSAVIAARGDSNAAFSNRDFQFLILSDFTVRVHYFNGVNQKFATSTATISLNRWHHIVWIARPNTQGNCKVFLDGVQIVSSSQSGNMNTVDRPLAIGTLRQSSAAWNTASQFNGDMAHLYYWNRGLTDAEAVNLFVATNPGY